MDKMGDKTNKGQDINETRSWCKNKNLLGEVQFLVGQMSAERIVLRTQVTVVICKGCMMSVHSYDNETSPLFPI